MSQLNTVNLNLMEKYLILKLEIHFLKKKYEIVEVKSNDVNQYIEQSNEYFFKIKNNLQQFK